MCLHGNLLFSGQENPDKGRIVNERHFRRLQGLMKDHGGQVGNIKTTASYLHDTRTWCVNYFRRRRLSARVGLRMLSIAFLFFLASRVVFFSRFAFLFLFAFLFRLWFRRGYFFFDSSRSSFSVGLFSPLRYQCVLLFLRISLYSTLSSFTLFLFLGLLYCFLFPFALRFLISSRFVFSFFGRPLASWPFCFLFSSRFAFFFFHDFHVAGGDRGKDGGGGALHGVHRHHGPFPGECPHEGQSAFLKTYLERGLSTFISKSCTVPWYTKR